MDRYFDPTGRLPDRIKAGVIRALCADGLLTPAQRDELLRRQRAAAGEKAGPVGSHSHRP